MDQRAGGRHCRLRAATNIVAPPVAVEVATAARAVDSNSGIRPLDAGHHHHHRHDPRAREYIVDHGAPAPSIAGSVAGQRYGTFGAARAPDGVGADVVSGGVGALVIREPLYDFEMSTMTAAAPSADGHPLVTAIVTNTGLHTLEVTGTLWLGQGPGGSITAGRSSLIWAPRCRAAVRTGHHRRRRAPARWALAGTPRFEQRPGGAHNPRHPGLSRRQRESRTGTYR